MEVQMRLMDEARCIDCNKPMTIQDLNRPTRKSYPHFQGCCVECANTQQKQWKSARNKESFQRLKQRTDDYEGHRQRLKRNRHKRHYDISPEEYTRLLALQDGLCASCGYPEKIVDHRTGIPRDLSVDHDHTTGQVRALLCIACNAAFGYLEESPERIQSLLRYAERVKANKL